jgi:energy-coupling factor transporter transmembrane protein EcfT
MNTFYHYHKLMPAFLYTVMVLCAALFGLSVFYLFRIPPNDLYKIIGFLFILFVFLAHLFSIPFYFISSKRIKFLDVKHIYRRSFRWGALSSLLVVGLLGLKAFDLINPINLGLLALFLLALFIKFKGKR